MKVKRAKEKIIKTETEPGREMEQRTTLAPGATSHSVSSFYKYIVLFLHD